MSDVGSKVLCRNRDTAAPMRLWGLRWCWYLRALTLKGGDLSCSPDLFSVLSSVRNPVLLGVERVRWLIQQHRALVCCLAQNVWSIFSWTAHNLISLAAVGSSWYVTCARSVNWTPNHSSSWSLSYVLTAATSSKNVFSSSPSFHYPRMGLVVLMDGYW